MHSICAHCASRADTCTAHWSVGPCRCRSSRVSAPAPCLCRWASPCRAARRGGGRNVRLARCFCGTKRFRVGSQSGQTCCIQRRVLGTVLHYVYTRLIFQLSRSSGLTGHPREHRSCSKTSSRTGAARERAPEEEAAVRAPQLSRICVTLTSCYWDLY